MTYPVGYCAEDCLGHDTKEEAVSHYTQYQLDKTIHFSKSNLNCPKPCMVCKEPTVKFAEIGSGIGQFYILCEKHFNREELEKLHKVPETFISSY